MSQVGYGPPVRIDGPLPQKRSYRLLDVATLIPTVDDHWANGAMVFPYPDDAGHVFDPCSSGSSRQKNPGTLPDSPHFGAFTGYLPVTCHAVSVGADAEWFRARALAALAAVESTIAERVFAKGEGMDALQPHLTDANLVKLNGGAATKVTEALGLLEKAIAATGRAGVIHASAATIIAWDAGGALQPPKNGQLVTANGTQIVSGAGYEGAHPDGSGAPSATSEWAFATGPVQYRQTEPFIIPDNYAQAFDRASNEYAAFAERIFLVDWDAVLQAGVLVDRSL